MGKRKGRGGRGGWGGHRGGHDVTSARGHACVIATCDVYREREGSKDLVTILTQLIEEIYPKEGEDNGKEDVDKDEKNMTAEQLIQQEVAELKAGNSSTQPVVSLQTGVKGVVLAKIRKPNVCPVRLVEMLFKQITEQGLSLSKHLVRIVPLQRVFFPNEEEMTDNIRALIGLSNVKKVAVESKEQVPDSRVVECESENTDERETKRSRVDTDAAETAPMISFDENPDGVIIEDKEELSLPSVTPTKAVPPLSYNISIKIRNHDTLKKDFIIQSITRNLPRHRFHYNYKVFKGMFVVNIFKNIAGIALIENYDAFGEFNISKLQQKHCQLSEQPTEST